MEFIIFLGSLDKQIIDLVIRAKYSIEENKAICLIDKKFVGFFNKNDKKIIICTENIKKIAGYNNKKNINSDQNHKTRLFVRRALRHEATHLAQACNNGNPTGILKDYQKKFNSSKLKALESSFKISGNLLKEYETYILEDKPRKVKEAIKKYCL